MNQWISVKDRLPNDDDFVLVHITGSYRFIKFESAIMIGSYFDGYGWELEELPEYENPGVTHWMPLPEPPEEVDLD